MHEVSHFKIGTDDLKITVDVNEVTTYGTDLAGKVPRGVKINNADNWEYFMRNIFAMVFNSFILIICGGSVLNTGSYIFHETVTMLPVETDGSASSDVLYVYFGDWPQTIKKTDVAIDETKRITIGFNTYYLGSDNCYYAKVVEHGYYSSHRYSDGSPVLHSWPQDEKIKYFKVEPIKWRVLTKNYKGTKRALLLAEKILDTQIPFYDDCYNFCDYKTSSVRSYLNTKLYTNECFLKSAFTEKAQDKISFTDLSNEDGIIISDKIFLLGLEDIRNHDYGFDETDLNTRVKYPTDYVLAKGIFTNMYFGSPWWLSSTQGTDGKAWCISSSGKESCCEAEEMANGIAPALTILLPE